jgi:VCBS repeat-containing protein
LVLEARIMFDGAAVATAAEAVKPVAAEAPVAHVAELGSVVAASQADSRSTAPAETAKAADTSKNAPETAKPVAAERATDGLASSTTKVLFVDSRVPDYQAIVAAAAADVKVVILDADHDGVQQIADALEGMHNVASISIVSHGDSGLLLLGNTALHAGDMAQYQAELGKIGSAMQAGGEILLYGCDVGAGSKGESFIHSLADATGAVVAASTDSTGDVAHGGNWDLEIATGALTSAPVLDVAKLANYDYSLYTTSVSTLAQLKAALATAATDNLDDIITLTANITFVSASDTITYAATDAHKTTIMGVGNTISGANLTQVLHINSGSGSVELNNLTITNGVASGKGGDSYDQTTATTADKVGGSGLGGGIFNAGTLTITNSTISNNKATGGGGGGGHIYQAFGGAGGGGSGAQGVGGASGGAATGTDYNGTPLVTPGAAGSSGSGGRGGSAYAAVQATQGGIGGSSAGGGAGGSTGASAKTYLAGGGSGGTAGAIGGGGGGAGFNGPGGRGGDAAGGIYNTGTLVITGSTVIGNLAAAGGGGGSGTAQEPTSTNVGPGGNGGNAYGGIWNNGGTVTSTGTTYTSNVAGAGKGGLGSGPGNSNGADGAVFADGNITSGPAVPPAITGTTAGQAINDNVTSTLHPFQGVTITGSSSTVTITLDSAAKGSFTAASLTAAGFTTSNGGLTYTHASDTAANLQTALQALVYQPVANRATVTATETTTFTVVINDGSQSVTDSTTTVVSTSINDAPTGLGNASVPAILEDAASPAGVAISALTGLNFADVDVSSSLGGIAVSGNTANSATQGVWQYSADAGAHWYVVGSVSTGSALMLSASSMLRFIPVADYNGTLSGLTVRAVDNTYTGGYTTSAASETRSTASVTTNGGSTAFAASTNTVSTSVTAVNDVPVFTKGGNQTVLEDAGAQTVSGWATGISAGAANESGQTLNFIVTNNNNALFSTQPSIDASGNLTFTGAANANGTATVTVAIHDNGGTANGGVDTSTTQTFTITITPVNDAPTGVGNLTLPTILEDVTAPAGTAISALSGLAFADVDSGDTLGGLAIVGNTANATTQGAWQYSTNGTNWYAIGTVSDGASLMVSASTQIRFVPVADYNGTPPSLTVRALDSSYAGSYSIAAATQTRLTTDTSSHGGSTAISDNTNTIGITVTAVNDAPTFTKGADQTVLEDAGAQTVSNWATNLVKGSADESSQTLSFTVTNSNNALFSAQPSIDASGNLTFTGAANANGTATVTVVLHDSGGTANGGVDTSTQTFTITITPVNDAPTGLPAVSGSSTEGQVLTASTSGIADVDGLVGVPFNHQWQVSADGTTGWVDISGATASTYTLDSAQVGKYVRDKVSFTDNGGTLETLFSAASSSIAGVVPQVDSISRAGSAAVSGSATSVVYNVTFNVAVTGVGADDFMLTTTTGNAAGVISSISGSGTSYQVTVNMLTGDGDLRLDLKSSGTGIASGSAMTIAGGFTAGQAYTLDHTPPSLTAVSMPNSPLRGGDVQTVTFTVANDGGSPLTLVSGTVGGYSLSGLTRINSTTYSAQFTVTSGGTDVAAGSDVPVSIVLADAAGNQNTAFTTPISQANDSINGNAPTLLNLSNASVQTSSGANALVGALSTTDASAGDTFTYALVSGAGDTNNTAFTLVNGNNLTVNDPATLGSGTYSVRIRTTDSGGNQLEQTFTITVSSYSAPVAVADTASATEAGGIANATAGVNPTGNVLANDQSSNTRTVTAIAGGAVGAARVGTYGSLTLNADGTYTYTVNNSNAAVQALRTNADTLTDTFTYTMADNTAATSTSTLTITIQGANDVPRDATALTTQQVTVSTPLLYVVPVGTFADVDAGDTLTYTATLNGGAPLPAWLTFNAATRTFSGTPTAVENLSIVVTATDLSATSVSNTFTLQVAAAAPSGGGGTPTTPTTPTDPQVPNNPQPVQPITAVEQTPLQIISETVVDTVTTPDWSANQMISETLIIRTTNTPILPTTFGNTAFVGTGTSFVSSSGSFSPANERYSPLSPTPFNDFQRTQTDGGWGLFSVVISPTGQSGLTILRGIDDQSFTPGDRLSFTVPADAFGHSDPQPGIVLKATLADARSLPTWLTFNSTTGLFEGTPPPGFKGELAIKVTAKDSSGHQAEVTFRVKAQSGRTSAEVPHGRSGLSEQLRSAAVRTALWASGRT